jgi:hypothetical protein
MTYILGAVWGPFEEHKPRFEAYRRYLDSIREQLPPAAFAFATADWHYNFADPRCPHDAWVESVIIAESAAGTQREQRRIDIQVRLLGAYHDGHIELHYRNVAAYTLEHPAGSTEPPRERGHGDWRDDEVRLSARGLVIHDVMFIGGSHWLIECEDIQYRWLPAAQHEEMPRDSTATP